LCVLPTLAVLAWGAARHLPWQEARQAAALSRAWGLAVSVEGLAYPRPGVTEWSELRLADAETGRRLARLEGVRLVESGGTSEVFVHTAEIEPGGAARLAGEAHARILQSAGAELSTHFACGTLVLHGGGARQVLHNLRGRLEPAPAGPSLVIDVQRGDTAAASGAGMRIRRQRLLHPPATQWEFTTGREPIALARLAPFLPAAEVMNPDCTMQGVIRGTWTGEAPTGAAETEFSGRLAGVDLDRLVSERFAHRLGGRANVDVAHARFRGGRLVEASADISAGPGVASRSLLWAAVEAMHCVPGAWSQESGAASPRDEVHYRELACRVTIDGAGVAIRGRCGSPRSTQAPGEGIVLAGPDGPLLVEPGWQPQPAAALVGLLVPRGGVLVPAVPQTEALLRVLPAPVEAHALPPTHTGRQTTP
jgi:hypothetical protein